VVIADDEELVRSGIAMILGRESDIDVVAEVSDGAEAIEVVSRLHPDVVLMDVRMPGVDGIEAMKAILSSAAHTASRPRDPVRVVMLTTYHVSDVVYRALRAGASGFLLKTCGGAELINAVRVVAAGDALLSPAVTRDLIRDFASRPDERLPAPSMVSSLTPKEIEVLALIASALSNAEISERLGVSEGTVKTHVTHIFRKLNAHDRAHAVVIAYRSRLVTLN
jgi:DNA-binding NarL/FixJ family response regulator